MIWATVSSQSWDLPYSGVFPRRPTDWGSVCASFSSACPAPLPHCQAGGHSLPLAMTQPGPAGPPQRPCSTSSAFWGYSRGNSDSRFLLPWWGLAVPNEGSGQGRGRSHPTGGTSNRILALFLLGTESRAGKKRPLKLWWQRGSP